MSDAGAAGVAVPPVGSSRRGEPPFTKLKPGPGRRPEEVRAHQRARLQAAAIELVAERGFGGVTVRSLTRTSGVSTRALYAQFANIDECLAASYRAVTRRTSAQLAKATELNGEDRKAGLRIWVKNTLEEVVDSPNAARLALVDAYDGGPAMLREISRSTAELERILASGTPRLPVSLSKAVAAGIERVVRSRLVDRRQGELPELAGELSDWVLAVYAEGTRLRRCGHRPRCSMPTCDRSSQDPVAPLRAIGGDRGRILAGVARLAAAGGYWNLTASRIRQDTGVPRRRFDCLYAGVADCYLEAAEALLVAAAVRAELGTTKTRGWRAHIEALASRLSVEIAVNSVLAEVGFLGILAPGAAGLRSRERLLSAATHLLRARAPADERLSPLAVEAATAASWRLVQAELEIVGRRSAPRLSRSLPRLIAATWPTEVVTQGREP